MPLDAVININKPPGISSFAAVSRVRRHLNIPKAGHAGTLDPLATGVLLVLAGQATRIARFLMDLPKSYRTTVRLGVETDTLDAEGDVTNECPVSEIDRGGVEEALASFVGVIEQVPPAYSAIKQHGQPLYRLARRNIAVDPAPRNVTIYSISLVEWQRPLLTFDVSCSRGTYVRSLARDIGRRLGCGGSVAALCRTAVGSFTVDDACDIGTMGRDEVLSRALPVGQALRFLPELEIDAGSAALARHGRTVTGSGAPPADGWVRLTCGSDLVALGQAMAGGIHPEIVFNGAAC
jgi:tRNA pseudouridine55 synthase